VLFDIRQEAWSLPVPELSPPNPGPDAPPGSRIGAGLRAWAARCRRPLVLFFDDIDALQGESLRSVLRQLRAGSPDRSRSFPWCVALSGQRDLRESPTSSALPEMMDPPRLRDFSEQEVRVLYGQHTAATGQIFTDAALARLFDLSRGQPWLTNALASEIVEGIRVVPPDPITPEHVEQARERLILERAPHLDSLAARLHEPRVRRILEPLLAGEMLTGDAYNDDLAYVRDLGLVAPKSPVRVANPIYREVIVRVLSAFVQENITADPRTFVRSDGRLDFQRLLAEFVEFWKEHGEGLEGGMSYHEVAPQLVLMGYLRRIVNGDGTIDREYGVGRGRIDLYVRWPYAEADGKQALQREAMELKVWAKGTADPLAKGLVQLEKYLDGLGLQEGTLVIFDRRPEAGVIEERTRFETAKTAKGYAVTVLRG
jgi:hypothetical protein